MYIFFGCKIGTYQDKNTTLLRFAESNIDKISFRFYNSCTKVYIVELLKLYVQHALELLPHYKSLQQHNHIFQTSLQRRPSILQITPLTYPKSIISRIA